MTDSDQDDGNRYCIDRRTILKLAGVTSGSAALTGLGLAKSRGNGSRGTDPNSPDFERIEPERPPPWAEINLPPEDRTRDLWFVEFAAPPTARGGKPLDHANERTQWRAQARREGITCIEKCDFTALWNGLSVRTDPASVTTLRGLDDVVAMYPVGVVEPTGGDPENSDHWDRWESSTFELDARPGPAHGQEAAPVGLPASSVDRE